MIAGIVVAFAGDNIPNGWLLCDGRNLNKNVQEYSALFEAIGTIHGGDGNPEFQIPDYRGMFLRGVDGGQGRDPDASSRTGPGSPPNAGNTGDRVGSVQPESVKSHSHDASSTVEPNPHQHVTKFSMEERESGDGGMALRQFGSGRNHFPSSEPTALTVRTSLGNFGGAETRPINAYVNYIIKL